MELASKNPSKRIVDRLDLQILLAVIVMFVSSWIYLNSIICDFTKSTPYNVQLSYIFVQYVVSLYLVLCLYLSSIKGNFIFVEDKDISSISQKWVQFFMQSWFPAALICVISLILCSATTSSWLIFGYVFLMGIAYYLRKNQFSKIYSFSVIVIVLVLFPLFLSFMTLTMKNVNILHDKDYYDINEQILITTQVNGYACDYEIYGLQESDLYPNAEYVMHKNMILVNATDLRDNMVSVGIYGPIKSLKDIVIYPLCKLANVDHIQSSPINNDNREYIFYKRVDINIKP